uniref:Aldedh domain-containing protein n=1 Tax=Hydatigena taeniaeformis TaxID=6205 RepID=A0A0R3XDA4_HYDTA
LKMRRIYLHSLLDFVTEKEDKIRQALESDLGKVLTSEILCVKYEIQQLLKNLRSWTKTQPMPKTRIFHKDECVEELLALGTVLIISSWSSPFQNIMIPLAGAIAAGNCAIIKPADLALATNQLFVEQIPKYFNRSVCQVLTCTLMETKDFLKEHRCDFIYFTGAYDDGVYIIPVYIDSSADIALAAKRVMWGKVFNCGQMAVAPDYVLCHADVQVGVNDKLVISHNFKKRI